MYNVSSFEQSTSPFSANSSEVVASVLAVNDPPQVDLTTTGELPQTHKDHVECSMYSIRSNFHVVKLSRIASFRNFCIFIFTVCGITAQALPISSKFSRDETYADGH